MQKKVLFYTEENRKLKSYNREKSIGSIHCANQKVCVGYLEIAEQEDGFQVKLTNIQSDTAIVDQIILTTLHII